MVTPSNIPPVAEDDNFSVDQSESVSGNVLTQNDGDNVIDTDGGDGSDLSVTHVNGLALSFDPNDDNYATVSVESGELRINASGEFTYTNSEGYSLGSASPTFEYTITDGTDFDVAEVTIEINDSAPVANDDANFISFDADQVVTKLTPIKGNVIAAGSSGDVPDLPLNSAIVLTQIKFDSDGDGSFGDEGVLSFDQNNTSHTINTGFGPLTINNDGSYVFILLPGIDIASVPETLQFEYMIEESGEILPESDFGILTINFSQSAQEGLSLDIGKSIVLDALSKPMEEQSDTTVEAKANLNDLDDILISNEETDLSDYLPSGTESNEVDLENLALLKVDDIQSGATDNGENVNSKVIANELFKEGGTLVSDNVVENKSTTLDLDSQEVL